MSVANTKLLGDNFDTEIAANIESKILIIELVCELEHTDHWKDRRKLQTTLFQQSARSATCLVM